MTGSQTTIVPTTLPSFPWNVGDKLDSVPLNNAFIALQNQINNLQTQLSLLSYLESGGSSFGTSATISWGGNTPVSSGPYVLTASAPYAVTLQTLTANVGSNGGYFTVTVAANGVPIPGLTNVVVNSSTNQIFNTVPPNTVQQGGSLTVTVSNVNGQPENAYLTFNSAVPTIIPTYSPTFGLIYVSPIVNATSNVIIQVNASTMSGTGTANATSMSLTTGQTNGSANGNATVAGTITWSGGGFPTLILDNTSQPGLDFDPLG
jgi:hypothetical protein